MQRCNGARLRLCEDATPLFAFTQYDAQHMQNEDHFVTLINMFDPRRQVGKKQKNLNLNENRE
jgi:hypothetical protein